jgi:hypothetical protein
MIFEEVSKALPRKLKAGSRMVKAIHGVIGRRKKQDVERMKATGRS